MKENDRKYQNRINQRRRRQGLMRIDYAPNTQARAIIEAERKRKGQDYSASAFLDAALIAWVNSTPKEPVHDEMHAESPRKWRVVEDISHIDDRMPNTKHRFP